MKLSIIFATLLFGSLSYAEAYIGYHPELEQNLFEKSVKECSFNPERYREVSLNQDLVLTDGDGAVLDLLKEGQSYHISGIRIERTEFSDGEVYEQEYVLLALPAKPVRPMTVRALDNISSLRVKAWKALECK